MDDLARLTALREAIDMHIATGKFGPHPGGARGTRARNERSVLRTAEVFLAWLRGPTSIRLRAGTVLDQETGQPSGTPTQEGNTMQLHDNEKVDLSASTQDARGFETADTLTWSIDDGSVAELVVSDDTKTCAVIAGTPGSAVINVTDGTRSATEAIDVITGDTVAIVIAEGPVTTQ